MAIQLDIISIKTTELVGGGFAGTAVVDGFDQPNSTVEFKTNASNNGLWMDGKQILGTTQFTASTRRQFSDKIRRYFGL